MTPKEYHEAVGEAIHSANVGRGLELKPAGRRDPESLQRAILEAAVAEYKNDLEAYTDAELERERDISQNTIDEETSWVEAISAYFQLKEMDKANG